MKYHKAYIWSGIRKNTRIAYKLRHFLSIQQLKQVYYNPNYLYISHAIRAWGSAYQKNLKKTQTKQNHVAGRILFCCYFCAKDWKRVSFIKFIKCSNSKCIYRLHALRCVHMWHKRQLPNFFQHASDMHNYNTRFDDYAAVYNLHKPRKRTNIGKPTISYTVIDLWKELPTHFKKLSTFSFSKAMKHYLVSDLYSNYVFFVCFSLKTKL